MANVMPRMEKCFMAADNKAKTREQRIESRISNAEESDKESPTSYKSKTGLKPGSPEWHEYWRIVFRRMK